METPKANMNQFAAICGVTPQALRDWMREGLPHEKPHRNSTEFDLVRAIHWVRDQKWRPQADDKARKARADADLAEMERDRVAGTLIRAEEAQRAWTNTLATLRTNLMSYPDRVLSRLEACTTPAEMVAVLRQEMKESLSGIVAELDKAAKEGGADA